MEVARDHRAPEQGRGTDPRTVDGLLRHVVLGLALAIGGAGCGAVNAPPAAVNAQRTSLIGKTIRLPREGRDDLVLSVRHANGMLEILVGDKAFVIPDSPLVPGKPIGESITDVEMDDEKVWITSTYADIELSRAEATRILEQLEALGGDALDGHASVVMSAKDPTLDAVVKTQRLFTGKRQGDVESFPIGLSRKKPDAALALQRPPR